MVAFARTFFFVAFIAGVGALALSQESFPPEEKNGQPQLVEPGRPKEQPAADQRGSDAIPPTERVLPAQKTAEELAREEAERHDKASNERWLTIWTAWLAIFTLMLFLAAAVQAGLFVWQLFLIRKSLEDTKVAAEAAKDGAKAARDSADISKLAMVASDRAYVHYNGCRWISHVDIADGTIFWRIRPLWVNSGNTPTRQLHVYAHYDLRDDELPDDHEFVPDPQLSPNLASIAPKNMIESGFRDFEGEDLAKVAKGEKHLYIWGVARYRDVFPQTEEHVTKFCVYARAITGDLLKGWDTKDNPVDIMFAGYVRHNCSDEDCG